VGKVSLFFHELLKIGSHHNGLKEGGRGHLVLLQCGQECSN